jgi:hypothetical protein
LNDPGVAPPANGARSRRIVSVLAQPASGLPIFIVVAGMVSLALGIDANWDLKNYHYYNPWALLHGRWQLDSAPAFIQTFHNPLPDLPFYALVASGLPASLIEFALGIPVGVGAYFFFRIARDLVGDLRIEHEGWALAAICVRRVHRVRLPVDRRHHDQRLACRGVRAAGALSAAACDALAQHRHRRIVAGRGRRTQVDRRAVCSGGDRAGACGSLSRRQSLSRAAAAWQRSRSSASRLRTAMGVRTVRALRQSAVSVLQPDLPLRVLGSGQHDSTNAFDRARSLRGSPGRSSWPSATG